MKPSFRLLLIRVFQRAVALSGHSSMCRIAPLAISRAADGELLITSSEICPNWNRSKRICTSEAAHCPAALRVWRVWRRPRERTSKCCRIRSRSDLAQTPSVSSSPSASQVASFSTNHIAPQPTATAPMTKQINGHHKSQKPSRTLSRQSLR